VKGMKTIYFFQHYAKYIALINFLFSFWKTNLIYPPFFGANHT